MLPKLLSVVTCEKRTFALVDNVNITEVYEKYKINQGLREHMLRVAAVAKLICDNSTSELDTKNIITACLVHDLGNLIKFDLAISKDLLEPEGLKYWTGVQVEMKEKYGDNEHVATERMVKELNTNEAVLFYFSMFGDEGTKTALESNSLGAKIATYSDMRVGLYGLVSLSDRMNDLRDRYIKRNMSDFSSEKIDTREDRLVEMEKVIFGQNKLQPADVTDEAIAEIQNSLLGWKIS